MVFHTSYSEVHSDWCVRSGVAYGVGATPDEAMVACLADINQNGFWESPGWLGTPKPPEAVVVLKWHGPDKPWWSAEFTDDFWFKHEWGYGDNPDDAVLALMSRTDYRHGIY